MSGPMGEPLSAVASAWLPRGKIETRLQKITANFRRLEREIRSPISKASENPST
jgi:hypothetical protein